MTLQSNNTFVHRTFSSWFVLFYGGLTFQSKGKINFFFIKKNIRKPQAKKVGYLPIFLFESENITLKSKVYNIKNGISLLAGFFYPE